MQDSDPLPPSPGVLPEPGLRARKKAETRERIHRAAMARFAEHGFDGARLSQIAADADVSLRTVHVHYPAKEDLVFGDVERGLEGFRLLLEHREPGVSVVDAVRSWLEHWITGWLEPDVVLQLRIAAEVPSVAERRSMIAGQFARPLAEAFGADLGVDPGELRPQLAAASVVTGLLQIERLAAERFANGGPPLSAAELADAFAGIARYVDAGIAAGD